MHTKQNRVKVLNPEIRFEFTIPDDIPKENVGVYAWEKLRRVCRSISTNGVKAIPVIPKAYTELVRYPLREGTPLR